MLLELNLKPAHVGEVAGRRSSCGGEPDEHGNAECGQPGGSANSAEGRRPTVVPNTSGNARVSPTEAVQLPSNWRRAVLG